MAKVIMVSKVFPAYHPKAGKPTLFPEKIWKALLDADIDVADNIYEVGQKLGNYQYVDEVLMTVDNLEPKLHTIRSGKRWKTGDKASLRIWEDKPYLSKQIVIAPDVELTVRDIEIDADYPVFIDGKAIDAVKIEYLAKNDGLSYIDMVHWFNKLPFSGQILCFSKIELPY